MMERMILEVVTWADIIICAALRWFIVVVPMALVLLLGVLTARFWMREGVDWIDYDASGEGPDTTKAWGDAD